MFNQSQMNRSMKLEFKYLRNDYQSINVHVHCWVFLVWFYENKLEVPYAQKEKGKPKIPITG